MDNFQAFCGAVKSADAITGGREKNQAALAFMFKKLEQFDIREVVKAIEKTCETSRNGVLLPDIMEKLKGKVSDNGAYAWSRVMHAIKQHGRYASITFGDPKIHYCIHVMGGWNTLCDMMIDEQPWRKKDFIEIYKDADSRGLSWGDEGIPQQMLSLIDMENMKKGYNSQLPKYVDCGRCNVTAPSVYSQRRAIETKKPANTIDFGKAVKGF